MTRNLIPRSWTPRSRGKTLQQSQRSPRSPVISMASQPHLPSAAETDSHLSVRPPTIVVVSSTPKMFWRTIVLLCLPVNAF
jgi:hypothetical protein